jgi:hypothetical protein
MSTSTDWAARPVPTAASTASSAPLSAEQLAAFVDRALSRTDGLLFTATPTEELDAIGWWQQLKDQAFAGQMREIVAAYNRASREAREFAGDEVGLAIGATSTTGSTLVAQAVAVTELPGLLEAVEAGQLTERHVLAVLRELGKVELTLEQRQAVVLVLLARFRGQAPGELAAMVARLVVQVDRAAAACRDEKATAGRRVWFSRDVDGQALLLARGPAAATAAIRACLEATLPLEVEPGDERSKAAREFDLLVDLLTGGAQAGHWQAEVVVPFSVAEGSELELAQIPGLGPILPSTTRDLLGQCATLTQIAVDDHGTVLAVSDPIRTHLTPAPSAPTCDQAPDPVLSPQLRRRLTAPPALRDLTGSAYRFPPRLRRYLETRDRTCVFPGCGRPAHRSDKDHRTPWPDGPTNADNGQCLCRHHHRAKHTVFTLTLDPDGTHHWTSRGGWRFPRQPKGY